MRLIHSYRLVNVDWIADSNWLDDMICSPNSVRRKTTCEDLINKGPNFADFVRFYPHTYTCTQQSLLPIMGGNDAFELSKYLWELKRKNKIPLISWKIVCKVYGNPKRNFCRLCLKERLLIVKFSNQDILNKRSEFISKCRYENQYCLKSIK